jgi:predicted ATPase/class 3 adenylate cyclase/Tfp pilus assembly protein PilF
MKERLSRKLLAIMFTDIVGFTQLMQHDEKLGLQLRQRHKDVIEDSHQAFDGEIVRYLGDGTLSLFSNALDAVLCAIEIQKEFGKPPEVPLRIGIHLGHVIIEPDAIIGDAVNIASRMESFSVSGGVLVSDTVQDQIKNQPEIQTVSLGKYLLKNVDRPYEIFAISVSGLTVPDPDHLEGKGGKTAILPGGLPTPATALLGRDDEVGEVLSSLEQYRIVTITGPGGIGKTRLSIEVTHRVADDFADRLAFVPMVNILDASGFIPGLASALNIKEAEGRGYRDGITAIIADKKALLVLDNLEQIIDAAVDIAYLVSTCSNLKILATSRTPLKLAAEREFPLSPLSVPQQERLGSFEDVAASPAVALFVDRARKANHRFDLTEENAPTVAEICRRLDGLPLALELAAARIRILSPGALLKRLTHILDVLSRGPRDLPERHQTLRATIDWSHSLLSDAEKMLFRRLAVFSGGFTLEGAEEVCGNEASIMVLDELESLLEKGLVRHADEEDRYFMLQTIKEFALEKLEAAGETAEIKRKHASYFLEIARRTHLGTQGHDQLERMERADQEVSNIQRALEWWLAMAEEGDEEAAELGLRLCGELWMYWHIRGMHLSARGWVEDFLEAANGQRDTPGTCAALLTAGLCSWTLGEYPRAVKELEASYQIAKKLGMAYEMASATSCLIISYLPMGEISKAAENARESLEIAREINNEWIFAFSLAFEGLTSFVSGELEAAEEKYREALKIQRKIGDYEGGGFSLGALAQLAAAKNEFQEADHWYQEAQSSYVRVGDRAEEARILEEMAWNSLKLADTARARRNFSSSIQAYNEIGSVRGIGLALYGLAATEQVEGSAYRAMEIAAAADRFSEEEGIVNMFVDNNPAKESIDSAKEGLSPEELSKASLAGRALAIEDVLEMAKRTM